MHGSNRSRGSHLKGLIPRVVASPRNFPCGARTAALRKFIRENVYATCDAWGGWACLSTTYAGRLANGCGRGGRKRTITFGSPRTRVLGVACARQLCQKRRHAGLHAVLAWSRRRRRRRAVLISRKGQGETTIIIDTSSFVSPRRCRAQFRQVTVDKFDSM